VFRDLGGKTKGKPDPIFFDGTSYVSAGEIADAYGFVRDYVARLCRSGRVRGRQIGKNWYVDECAFKEFFIHREHALALHHQQLALERRHEYQAAQVNDSTAPSLKPPIESKEQKSPRYPRGSHIRSMQTALAAQAARALGQVSQFASAPTGVSDAAVRAAHVPLYAISPWMEFVHKAIALTFALVLVYGAYAMINPQFARFSENSIADDVRSLARSSDGARSLATAAQAQLAAAAENPIVAFASLWDGIENLARSPALAGYASDGFVTVSVQPFSRPQLPFSLTTTAATTTQ
jgi:hypothetical protein